MRVLMKMLLLVITGLTLSACDVMLPRDKNGPAATYARHNVPGYYGTGHDDELCEGPCDCPESGYYYNGYRENGWRYCIAKKR